MLGQLGRSKNEDENIKIHKFLKHESKINFKNNEAYIKDLN